MVIWIVGITVLLGFLAYGITKHIEARSLSRQLFEHKEAIKKWQEYSATKLQEAELYKRQARELAEQVLKASARITAKKKESAEIKKKMDSVEAPQTTTEITDKLKEQGYSPEVRCEP